MMDISAIIQHNSERSRIIIVNTQIYFIFLNIVSYLIDEEFKSLRSIAFAAIFRSYVIANVS